MLILIAYHTQKSVCSGFAYSGKSREELIREKIMESEMRVAAQMGMSNPGTMTAGLTGLLTTTGTFLPANSS